MFLCTVFKASVRCWMMVEDECFVLLNTSSRCTFPQIFNEWVNVTVQVRFEINRGNYVDT